MFIRQTATSNKLSGESYTTYRLVSSERIGKRVRQITLLNLGRHFGVPRDEWPRLCTRIDAILSGQASLLAELVPVPIEALAQRYAARLIAARPKSEPNGQITPAAAAAEPIYAEVAIDTVQLTRPRSVGVEQVGLAAMSWLGLDEVLISYGFNAAQRAVVAGSIIGRMAAPGSEAATWRWLTERSGLGELLDVDFESMSVMRLYRASDLLVRYRERLESTVFSRVFDLFELNATVTLYDLTNTYFEGVTADNAKAARGHSKEKRSDCPLVTLGLVLDGSGFVRRSKTFPGNVAEGTTLADMLAGLAAPQGALVIMDRGIATEANIEWLRQNGYRYLVMSRERTRQFDPEQAVEILTSGAATIKLQRVVDEDGKEVRLYCHSEARQLKETAITNRFVKSFEAGLVKLAEGLAKPRCEKNLTKVIERVGRLKERSRGVAQHYDIVVTPDETGKIAASITWTKAPIDNSMMTHPGVYCLRSNETTWDEQTLWRTYTMLTDLEAVFRSLKSELGLRPVFHHTEDRTEGHLFLTVLAYQLVQTIRLRLKAHASHLSWTALREILSVQQRVTVTFRQRDGHTLHVRKATVAEPALRELYDKLNINPSPGGVKKYAA